MILLNFPAYNLRFQKKKNNKIYIFCIIRKNFYLLTPEEWVRQHTLHFFIFEKKYDPRSISVEVPLQCRKRADIIVYNRESPYIIVECKSPFWRITQKNLEQIILYHMILKSSYLMLTNGLKHIFYKFDGKNQKLFSSREIPFFTT
jgi:hypothetical protein